MLKKIDRSVLYKSATRGAVAQLLAVCICTAVLFLFAALTYSQITLPKYTTSYPQKDTQQVVNLIITVVAAVIGILLSHCRRLTNEAETVSELRNEELTIPRLHVHIEAAGGSKVAMALPAVHNRKVWHLVAIYLFAMIMFGFLNSVLSVIFVIEAVISGKGEPGPAYIPLSSEIPEMYNGVIIDPCRNEIAAPGCTYDLALTSLSSQLVTNTPYTIGGVTFESPNGTLGLPYYALKHFSENVASSPFEEEYRQYCLPVLDPHIIKCKEEPFIQYYGETNSSLLLYQSLNVYETNWGPPNHSVPHVVQITDAGMYKIVLDYPSDNEANIKYRTNDQGQGTMLVKQHPDPAQDYVSVITGSNNAGEGYASLLYRMMYGVDPETSSDPNASPFFFVAKCEFASLNDNHTSHSSWRNVDFTLKNGVIRANVTEERCPNPKGPAVSGFGDLYFALEGAGAVLSSSDGYSKLFNNNTNLGTGSSIFKNMSRLDATVNKIYHIVQTSWSETNYEYAMLNQEIYNNPIIMKNYPHLYVIRISWTPTTYIGLVLSILITLNAFVLAGRWVWATYRLGWDTETWNLLRPVDLMAYSLAAYQDLIHDLNTVEHRKLAMRGKTRTVLREHPIKEGTENLISLVKSSTQSPVQGRASMSFSGTGDDASTVVSSPVSTLRVKIGSGGALGETVEEKVEDEERGDNQV